MSFLENIITIFRTIILVFGEKLVLANSMAITKIQSIILILIIVVAGVGGGVAYVLLSNEDQSSETIKIGVLDDLDSVLGKPNWQAAILAVEEINAEGGIIGRQVELIGEDTDAVDPVILTSALNKLITHHKVDFIVTGYGGPSVVMIQDIILILIHHLLHGVLFGIVLIHQKIIIIKLIVLILMEIQGIQMLQSLQMYLNQHVQEYQIHQ